MAVLGRAYGIVLTALGIVSAALIGFLAVGITVNVIMRRFGGGELRGALELFEYGLFLTAFVGAPWVLYKGAHVRVDVIFTVLSERAGRMLETLADLAGLATALVLLYYSHSVFAETMARNSRVIKEFIFPEWWLFTVVTISFGLIAIEFLRRLFNAWRGVRPNLEGL